MSRHKGQSGPLSLRCPRCGKRNLGNDKPIKARLDRPCSFRNGKFVTWVGCECGWHWFTSHASMRRSYADEARKQ